ncbi:hypothetical protein D623_10002868 [Myotis brandtii]|uniref:Protein phosphatase 1 regulatory subunit 35 C-terminal domain-containing protein n=1 Tax=Myotis brandtii TaxID=109478 RepID=S7MM02_MYOBR|nr:hypothetical protein D623_10002868 [Myotis brandtii]
MRGRWAVELKLPLGHPDRRADILRTPGEESARKGRHGGASERNGLNVPRSKRLFRDLVSLQVPEEQVLSAALRERLALLPPQARAPPPKLRPRPSEDTFLMHRTLRRWEV